MDDDGWGVLLLIGAVAAALLAYNNFFYTTGQTWYEECWKLTTQTKSFLDKPPVAPDPYTERLWKSCPSTAERGVYGEGLIFAGLPKDDQDKAGSALAKACPSSWTDVPLGGLHFLGIRLIQDGGGTKFIDKFLPAEWTVGRYFKNRWPQCNAERKRQGFPRIVETTTGRFDWETRCIRCEQRAE